MTAADWDACGDPERMYAALEGRPSDRKWRLYAAACARAVVHLNPDPLFLEAMREGERAAEVGYVYHPFPFYEALRSHPDVAGHTYLPPTAAIPRMTATVTRRAVAWAAALTSPGFMWGEARDHASESARHATIALAAAAFAVRRRPGRRRMMDDYARLATAAFGPNALEDFLTTAIVAVSPASGGSVRVNNVTEVNGYAFLAHLVAARRTVADLLRCVVGNPFRPVAFDPAWRTADVVALASAAYESRDFATLPFLADALEDAGCADADVLAHCRGSTSHARGCWVVDAALGRV